MRYYIVMISNHPNSLDNCFIMFVPKCLARILSEMKELFNLIQKFNPRKFLCSQKCLKGWFVNCLRLLSIVLKNFYWHKKYISNFINPLRLLLNTQWHHHHRRASLIFILFSAAKPFTKNSLKDARKNQFVKLFLSLLLFVTLLNLFFLLLFYSNHR